MDSFGKPSTYPKESFDMPERGLTREQRETLDQWKRGATDVVNANEFSRWLEETCPRGMLIVQGRPALAGNEIEWSDAVRRAKAWCEANPVNEDS